MPVDMLNHKLDQDLLNDFSVQILNCQSAGQARTILQTFLTALCHFAEIDLHPAQFLDEDFTLTPFGKAVSPTTAAQCAEDVERSRVFMQAVYLAVQQRLMPEQPLQLLYAGTGPLGWLVLPLLSQFNAQQIQITALDIHQYSLDTFRRVCEKLGVADRIAAWICADATQWQAEPGIAYDVILSETMNQFLEQEPQVQIFANLQQYLTESGCLIPEEVRLSVEVELCDGQKRHSHALGELFTLNRASAQALASGNQELLAVKLLLPDFEPGLLDIKLCTEIQVYQTFWLLQKQSQLTLPKKRNQVLLKPNSTLEFTYQLNQLPTWQLSYQEHLFDLVPSDDLSVEGIYHLHRLWQKTLFKRLRKPVVLSSDEWLLDRALLDLIGIGLHPGMQLLHGSDRLSVLQQEIRQLKLTTLQKQEINQKLIELISKPQTHDIPIVLSTQQVEFWQQHGYLVVPGVLTPEQCEQSRQAIWQYLRASPEQPDSWYHHQAPSEKIMLPLFRHPALDANRQVPILRQVFEQLWQRTDLVMSTDRVSFNPPQTASWKYPGPQMHWDMPLKAPVSFATQGLIYLNDTPEQQGAFCCVPGFHLQIEQWLQTQPQDEVALQQQNWAQWPVKAIAANAGDLIIWHHALPHGPSVNSGSTPRMVQYVNCYPLTGMPH